MARTPRIGQGGRPAEPRGRAARSAARRLRWSSRAPDIRGDPRPIAWHADGRGTPAPGTTAVGRRGTREQMTVRITGHSLDRAGLVSIARGGEPVELDRAAADRMDGS